jgi:large subunit ribosomal protein L18
MSKNSFKKNRLKFKINYSYPVVVVSRSNKYIIAQVLAPETKNTMVTISTQSIKKGTKTEKSLEVGKQIAQFLETKNFSKAVFDRNGYIFTGRVKAIAEGVKNNNIII